jgi:predicted RNase H-like HicB family nuclease
MNFTPDFEQKEDGRWIAEVAELRGVLAYGATPEEAILKVEALAMQVISEVRQEKASP